MTKVIHPIAGTIALLTILTFWLSTALSELFAGSATVTTVKTLIPWGFIILMPALMAVGGSGFQLGKKMRGSLVASKKKRMPFIAANGILILIPSALYLSFKAQAGAFDAGFYAVQALELIAGAANIALLGLNMRDGLRMTGKLRRKPQAAEAKARMKSTSSRYGTVAVTLHWLSAGFILALLASGFRAASLGDMDAKASLLSVHVVLGIGVLVLTLARILWWMLADHRPDPLAGSTGVQQKTATVIHLLFYIITLGMVASGIGMLVLTGAAPAIFDGVGAALPNFHEVLPRGPHGLGARLMVVLLMLHVLAALWHHFARGDGALWRMWYGDGQ